MEGRYVVVPGLPIFIFMAQYIFGYINDEGCFDFTYSNVLKVSQREIVDYCSRNPSTIFLYDRITFEKSFSVAGLLYYNKDVDISDYLDFFV